MLYICSLTGKGFLVEVKAEGVLTGEQRNLRGWHFPEMMVEKMCHKFAAQHTSLGFGIGRHPSNLGMKNTRVTVCLLNSNLGSVLTHVYTRVYKMCTKVGIRFKC